MQTIKKENKDIFENRIPDNLIKALIGCYILTHKTSGRFYIGSTRNYAKRQGKHISELRRGVHGNVGLQQLYDEDPIFEFKFIITAIRYLDRPVPKKDIQGHFDLEQSMLDKFRDNPLLLNIGIDARYANKGLFASIETKEKQRISGKKRIYSEEDLIRIKQLGRWRLKSVNIEGVEYESASSAAIILNLHKCTIAYRLNSIYFKNWQRC